MLERTALAYANVEFVSPLYRFEQLCESVYLAEVFARLREVMGSSFQDYRFVIFSGPDSNDLETSCYDPARTVVLHISDESSSVPHALCARVRAVFKCYLPAEGLEPNLHPLPLGYVASTPVRPALPVNQRRQSLFFSGNLNQSREEMFRVLATPRFFPCLAPMRLLGLLNPSRICDGFVSSSYLRFTDGFRQGLDGETYAEHLADSKIVLCPRGFRSRETFRHFEAMRAGAIVLSERLPRLRLYTDSPIIMIDDWREARGVITRLLACPEALAERQQATLTWWHKVCSERAVAAQIADVLS